MEVEIERDADGDMAEALRDDLGTVQFADARGGDRTRTSLRREGGLRPPPTVRLVLPRPSNGL